MSAPKQPTALFIADSHFHLNPSAGEQQRLESFLRLLEEAHGVDHLFLLGDIFDFWFDYPHFRLKGYESLLQGLDRIRAAGVQLHFVGGNHDIWAADYFHERYGCEVSPIDQVIPLGDLRIRLTHGDGLLGHDWAYNTFRDIVRTRAGIVLAKSLHPEVLFAISTWLSGKSRGATREEASQIEEKAAAWLQSQSGGETGNPWDLMVIGHVHHGFDLQHGTRRMVALAGWLDPLGFGMLREGEFRLCRYPEDSPAR